MLSVECLIFNGKGPAPPGTRPTGREGRVGDSKHEGNRPTIRKKKAIKERNKERP
jgi:hypothetical protein